MLNTPGREEYLSFCITGRRHAKEMYKDYYASTTTHEQRIGADNTFVTTQDVDEGDEKKEDKKMVNWMAREKNGIQMVN